MSIELGNQEPPLREEALQETPIFPVSFDVATQVQDTIQTPEEILDTSTQIEEKLGKFKEFAEKNNISGYEVFETFINQASPEIQTQFLDATNLRLLRNNIKEAWIFPVNEFEFRGIIIDQSANQEVININLETADVNLEILNRKIEEAEGHKERLLNFKNSLGNIQLSDPLLNSYFEQLVQLWPVNQDTAEAYTILGNNIKSRLESTQEIEKNILPQARVSGNYEAVKNSLITLGGGENGSGWAFEARILAWELGEQTPTADIPAEQRVRTSAALGTPVNEIDAQAEKSGNIFTLDIWDGAEINYDVVSGARNIELDGYALDSNIEDTGDYQTPKLEYMEVEQEHLPLIQLIQSIAEALKTKQIGTDELAEIKATIRAIPGVEALGINFENLSWEEIQAQLRSSMETHQTAVKEARDTYQETLLGLRDGYMALLDKKDKKVKDVLRFFESIGFTQIPQYITDQVIETLNSNSALASQLGFNEKIDLSNGELGMNKNSSWENDENLDLQDMKAFAEFVNKMLGVTDSEGNPPINISALGTMNSAIWENGDTRMQDILNRSWLLIGGAGKARQNLEQYSTLPSWWDATKL